MPNTVGGNIGLELIVGQKYSEIMYHLSCLLYAYVTVYAEPTFCYVASRKNLSFTQLYQPSLDRETPFSGPLNIHVPVLHEARYSHVPVGKGRGVRTSHVCDQVYAESAVLVHTFFRRERRDPSCRTRRVTALRLLHSIVSRSTIKNQACAAPRCSRFRC